MATYRITVDLTDEYCAWYRDVLPQQRAALDAQGVRLEADVWTIPAASQEDAEAFIMATLGDVPTTFVYVGEVEP